MRNKILLASLLSTTILSVGPVSASNTAQQRAIAWGNASQSTITTIYGEIMDNGGTPGGDLAADFVAAMGTDQLADLNNLKGGTAATTSGAAVTALEAITGDGTSAGTLGAAGVVSVAAVTNLSAIVTAVGTTPVSTLRTTISAIPAEGTSAGAVTGVLAPAGTRATLVAASAAATNLSELRAALNTFLAALVTPT